MYLSRNTNLTRNIIQCSSFAVDDRERPREHFFAHLGCLRWAW